MRNLESLLKNRQIIYPQLKEYGFKENKGTYCLTKELIPNFQVIINITKDNITSQIIDLKSKEEYILVDVKTTLGEYASNIKAEYENFLNDFIKNCTLIDVFKNSQTKEIITYIKTNYHDDLEFLWDNLDAAIWRNKTSNKWYGLLMKVPEAKIVGTNQREVEIINLHCAKDEMAEILKKENIFPGYHMNKKSWLTIILDGRVKTKDIIPLITNSYNLAQKK